jgi:hypothetical protein
MLGQRHETDIPVCRQGRLQWFYIIAHSPPLPGKPLINLDKPTDNSNEEVHLFSRRSARGMFRVRTCRTVRRFLSRFTGPRTGKDLAARPPSKDFHFD